MTLLILLAMLATFVVAFAFGTGLSLLARYLMTRAEEA